MKNHPANTIMQNHYHRARKDKERLGLQEANQQGEVVDEGTGLPHILGLSASLVIKSNLKTMR